MKSDAASELLSHLLPYEIVEAVMFGAYGWGDAPQFPGEEWEPYGDEEDPPCVPFDRRGVPLTWDEAEPFMRGWSFYGGFGSPNCYATYVYTNMRIFYVSQYDGSTALRSLPRHPSSGTMPQMPGD